MKLTHAQVAEARDLFRKMVRQGSTPDEAGKAVARAVALRFQYRKRMGMAGLGDEIPLTAAEVNAPVDSRNVLQRVADLEPVAKIRATVSPWLWVTSVVSFGMALLNRHQIALMFSGWKRRGQAKG